MSYVQRQLRPRSHIKVSHGLRRTFLLNLYPLHVQQYMDAGCGFIARSRRRSFCRREVQVSIVVAGILMTVILLSAKFAATLPNGQNHWIPCAVIDCGVATTLKNAPLQMLKNRKRDSSVTLIEDYYTLNSFNATDLRKMYFDVPKIVHQVWLGEQDPPVAWIDSWR